MELKITSKGKEYTVLYDEEDYELVRSYKWGISKPKNKSPYVRAPGKMVNYKIGKTVLLHRLICNIHGKEGVYVDHINHDTLDNRRINLRTCSMSENNMNAKKQKNTTNQYIGVSWSKYHQSWRAYITINNRQKFLGYWEQEKDAAIIRDFAAILYRGEFAYLNFKQYEKFCR